MKIAVISAADRCGATASTLLIAQALASTQGCSSRICYTGENLALKRYLGKDALEHDATRTISQVSKLLEAKAIAPDALGDYCTPMCDGVDIMDTWDSGLTEEEVVALLTFTFSKSTADYTICDITHHICNPVSQQLLGVCDMVIIVSEPSRSSLMHVRELKENASIPGDVPVMLLVPKYNEEIAAIDTLAKEAQFSKRATCKLHYNPLLVKYCNSGQLDTVIPYILQKDPRVVELNNDLKECIQFILSTQGTRLKWEG